MNWSHLGRGRGCSVAWVRLKTDIEKTEISGFIVEALGIFPSQCRLWGHSVYVDSTLSFPARVWGFFLRFP